MAVVKKGAVHVWNIVEDPWRQKVVKFKVPASPVQLAIHPTEPIIYFADRMGKIYTYDLANQCEVEKMHWHPRAPLTLEATPDGRHLLSGGEECVMVVWDVEQSERQFFPHLGAHVLGAISNNSGDYYAILLRHNSVLLVSPSLMKPIGRYDGVRSLPKQCKIGLVKDPRVPSAVFLNAIPGQIQSFDPIRDCTFDGDIDVCQQNIVGRGKKGKELIYSDVYHVAFSVDGNWMATYDRRMTDIRRLHHDVLRFWRRRKGGQYQVYTAFDVPHNEPINKIVFRPTRISGLYQCATVGADGKVKVWANSGRRVLKVTDDGKTVAQITWENKSSVTHKTLRCNSAAYSKDGSVLAVGFGKTIRLLDPDTLELLGSLQTFGGQSDIQQVLIVGDYLIGTDASKIYVWNLASMKIIWTLAISTSCLKMHPEGELFSVVTLVENASIVLMFSPCSPVPVHCHRHTLPIRDIEFVSVEWRSEPVLVLLDAQNLLHVLSVSSNVTLPAFDEVTPYDLRRKEVATQLAASLVTNPEERPVVLAPTKPVKMNCINMAKLLLADVPSHLLPNTLDLFEHFIMHQRF
jgi:WD40 repeat protein